MLGKVLLLDDYRDAIVVDAQPEEDGGDTSCVSDYNTFAWKRGVSYNTFYMQTSESGRCRVDGVTFQLRSSFFDKCDNNKWAPSIVSITSYHPVAKAATGDTPVRLEAIVKHAAWNATLRVDRDSKARDLEAFEWSVTSSSASDQCDPDQQLEQAFYELARDDSPLRRLLCAFVMQVLRDFRPEEAQCTIIHESTLYQVMYDHCDYQWRSRRSANSSYKQSWHQVGWSRGPAVQHCLDEMLDTKSGQWNLSISQRHSHHHLWNRRFSCSASQLSAVPSWDNVCLVPSMELYSLFSLGRSCCLLETRTSPHLIRTVVYDLRGRRLLETVHERCSYKDDWHMVSCILSPDDVTWKQLDWDKDLPLCVPWPLFLSTNTCFDGDVPPLVQLPSTPKSYIALFDTLPCLSMCGTRIESSDELYAVSWDWSSRHCDKNIKRSSKVDQCTSTDCVVALQTTLDSSPGEPCCFRATIRHNLPEDQDNRCPLVAWPTHVSACRLTTVKTQVKLELINKWHVSFDFETQHRAESDDSEGQAESTVPKMMMIPPWLCNLAPTFMQPSEMVKSRGGRVPRIVSVSASIQKVDLKENQAPLLQLQCDATTSVICLSPMAWHWVVFEVLREVLLLVLRQFGVRASYWENHVSHGISQRHMRCVAVGAVRVARFVCGTIADTFLWSLSWMVVWCIRTMGQDALFTAILAVFPKITTGSNNGVAEFNGYLQSAWASLYGQVPYLGAPWSIAGEQAKRYHWFVSMMNASLRWFEDDQGVLRLDVRNHLAVSSVMFDLRHVLTRCTALLRCFGLRTQPHMFCDRDMRFNESRLLWLDPVEDSHVTLLHDGSVLHAVESVDPCPFVPGAKVLRQVFRRLDPTEWQALQRPSERVAFRKLHPWSTLLKQLDKTLGKQVPGGGANGSAPASSSSSSSSSMPRTDIHTYQMGGGRGVSRTSRDTIDDDNRLIVHTRHGQVRRPGDTEFLHKLVVSDCPRNLLCLARIAFKPESSRVGVSGTSDKVRIEYGDVVRWIRPVVAQDGALLFTDQTPGQPRAELACPLCIERVPDTLLLNCQHMLCRECALRWKLSGRPCMVCQEPVLRTCRLDLTEGSGSMESSSDEQMDTALALSASATEEVTADLAFDPSSLPAASPSAADSSKASKPGWATRAKKWFKLKRNSKIKLSTAPLSGVELGTEVASIALPKPASVAQPKPAVPVTETQRMLAVQAPILVAKSFVYDQEVVYYRVGQPVAPLSFDGNPNSKCQAGLHGFRSMQHPELVRMAEHYNIPDELRQGNNHINHADALIVEEASDILTQMVDVTNVAVDAARISMRFAYGSSESAQTALQRMRLNAHVHAR